MELTFFGVRGSTPCSCPTTAEIGGNTSCVLVTVDDSPPFVLDVGTGARYCGAALQDRAPAPEVVLLVTHLHWDHVQGLPFFAPILDPDNRLTMVGPDQGPDETLRQAMDVFVKPPLFPVSIDQLPASVRMRETSYDTMEWGRSLVTVRAVPHCGPTNGYRIDGPDGGSVAYLPDHQQPASMEPTDEVIELCAGVDVLIHDAQYSADQFEARSDWGHSTPAFAVEVARRSGARRLVLFHHDPTNSSADIERLADEAVALAGSHLEVIVASEGLSLTSGLRANERQLI